MTSNLYYWTICRKIPNNQVTFGSFLPGLSISAINAGLNSVLRISASVQSPSVMEEVSETIFVCMIIFFYSSQFYRLNNS